MSIISLSNYPTCVLKIMIHRMEKAYGILEISQAGIPNHEWAQNKLLLKYELETKIKQYKAELKSRPDITQKLKKLNLLLRKYWKTILMILITITLSVIIWILSSVNSEESNKKHSNLPINRDTEAAKMTKVGNIKLNTPLYVKLSNGKSSEIPAKEGSRLKISGNFKRDSGLCYWICFVDEEYIWPQLRIDGSEFSEKEVTVPKRFSEGKEGKLVLVSVKNKVDKIFDEWNSTKPLFRSLNKTKIIKEIKINIK